MQSKIFHEKLGNNIKYLPVSPLKVNNLSNIANAIEFS